MDQPGRVASPARGQLIQGKCFFSCVHSRLRIWSRETGSSVASRVSPLILHALRLNHQSSIINHQSSIINHLSSIIYHLSSIINHQSSIINHQSSIINHQSSIINHQSGADSRAPSSSLPATASSIAHRPFISTVNRHRVSPEFFVGSGKCVPMASTAESPPAQGQ